MHKPLPALQNQQAIQDQIYGKKLVIFLDYDGTLTPIVARPELAVLSEEMRQVLRRLSQRCPVGIISGRFREDVEDLVQIPELYYAGSHGFDIHGPNLSMTPSEVKPLLPLVEKAFQRIAKATQGIGGCLVENKKYAITVHYRLVSPNEVPKIEKIVDEINQEEPGLRKTLGKKVFELRVNYPWDKGKALLYFLQALGLDGSHVVPFYLGDDDTDEDAFAVLQERGVGIIVSESPQDSMAKYSVKTVSEVKDFLEQLSTWLRRDPK